jgi:hypothetical protein
MLMTENSTSEGWKHNPVYMHIRQMAITHAFTPSLRIQPEPLADELFVSSTPIREALIRLTVEGLVNEIPKAGFFAKAVSEPEIRDAYQVRRRLLDWSLSVVKPPGAVPAMLKPSKRFALDEPFSPAQTVDLKDALFVHIVRQSGSTLDLQSIEKINALTYFVRLTECELFADVAPALVRLCRIYHAREMKAVQAALHDFHEQRLQRLPEVFEAIHRARIAA